MSKIDYPEELTPKYWKKHLSDSSDGLLPVALEQTKFFKLLASMEREFCNITETDITRENSDVIKRLEKKVSLIIKAINAIMKKFHYSLTFRGCHDKVQRFSINYISLVKRVEANNGKDKNDHILVNENNFSGFEHMIEVVDLLYKVLESLKVEPDWDCLEKVSEYAKEYQLFIAVLWDQGGMGSKMTPTVERIMNKGKAYWVKGVSSLRRERFKKWQIKIDKMVGEKRLAGIKKEEIMVYFLEEIAKFTLEAVKNAHIVLEFKGEIIKVYAEYRRSQCHP